MITTYNLQPDGSLAPVVVDQQGIERVEQRINGCFSACVSMLTGIDDALLPIAPPLFFSRGTRKPRFLDERELSALNGHYSDDNGTVPLATLSDWQKLLPEYNITATTIKPDVPAIQCCRQPQGGAHAVVYLPGSEYCIDPGTSPDNLWSTIYGVDLFVVISPKENN